MGPARVAEHDLAPIFHGEGSDCTTDESRSDNANLHCSTPAFQTDIAERPLPVSSIVRMLFEIGRIKYWL
jgi:hypothetical protein